MEPFWPILITSVCAGLTAVAELIVNDKWKKRTVITLIVLTIIGCGVSIRSSYLENKVHNKEVGEQKLKIEALTNTVISDNISLNKKTDELLNKNQLLFENQRQVLDTAIRGLKEQEITSKLVVKSYNNISGGENVPVAKITFREDDNINCIMITVKNVGNTIIRELSMDIPMAFESNPDSFDANELVIDSFSFPGTLDLFPKSQTMRLAIYNHPNWELTMILFVKWKMGYYTVNITKRKYDKEFVTNIAYSYGAGPNKNYYEFFPFSKKILDAVY